MKDQDASADHLFSIWKWTMYPVRIRLGEGPGLLCIQNRCGGFYNVIYFFRYYYYLQVYVFCIIKFQLNAEPNSNHKANITTVSFLWVISTVRKAKEYVLHVKYSDIYSSNSYNYLTNNVCVSYSVKLGTNYIWLSYFGSEIAPSVSLTLAHRLATRS